MRRVVILFAAIFSPVLAAGPARADTRIDARGAASGYEQVSNPGPLKLVAGGSGDIPTTRLDLAGSIREGLAQRAQWLQTTTLSPAERAPRVLAYTLPRTAPQGAPPR